MSATQRQFTLWEESVDFPPRCFGIEDKYLSRKLFCSWWVWFYLGFLLLWDSALHLSHQSQCMWLDFNSEALKCTASFPRQSLILGSAQSNRQSGGEGFLVLPFVDALSWESCSHSHDGKASGLLWVHQQGCSLASTLCPLLLQHPTLQSLLLSEHHKSGQEDTQK